MPLDTKFYGTIRKAKDDTIVPPDQYVVFLAKDNAFAATLPIYRQVCVSLGVGGAQIVAIDELIARVSRWRAENPEKCKLPDIEPGERFILP